MSDLFPFMAALAREQAENTRIETSQRRMLESFAKARAKRAKPEERTRGEVEAEMLANFNANEAM